MFFVRLIDWPPVCLVVMSKAKMRRTQNASANAHTAEDHRDEGERLQQALQHHCFAIPLNFACSLIHPIPTTSEHTCLQLPSLHQALKPQHFDASDSNRPALKVPLNPPQRSHRSIRIQGSLRLLFLEEPLELSGK